MDNCKCGEAGTFLAISGEALCDKCAARSKWIVPAPVTHEHVWEKWNEKSTPDITRYRCACGFIGYRQPGAKRILPYKDQPPNFPKPEPSTGILGLASYYVRGRGPDSFEFDDPACRKR